MRHVCSTIVVLFSVLMLATSAARGEHRLSGRVVDETGNGVAGASVLLDLPAEEGECSAPLLRLTADAEGRWSHRAVGLPEGRKIGVGAHHVEFAMDAVVPMESVPVEALVDGKHDVTLLRGTEIRGRVVDETGKPVEGAGVAVGAIRNVRHMTPEFPTNAAGEFRFFAPANSDVCVSIFKKGFGPSQQKFRIGNDPVDLSFTLDQGHPMTVKVVDEKGEPVQSARLLAGEWRDTMVIGSYHNADSGGVIHWPNAPVEPVTFSVHAEGFESQFGVTLTAGPDLQVINLHPQGQLTATVVDDVSGEPLPSVSVRVTYLKKHDDLESGQMLRQFIDFRGGQIHLLEHVGATMQLRIEAMGYAQLETEVFPKNFGVITREYRLKREAPLTGQVTWEDGSPARDVTVYLVGQDWVSLSIRDGKVERPDEQGLLSTLTDAEGRFSFPRRKAYHLAAIHPDGIALGEHPVVEGEPLRLQKWGRVEGVAMQGAMPLVNERIIWNYSGLDLLNRFVDGEKIGAISVVNSTQTDDEGRFTLDHIMPGKQSLYRVLPPDGSGFSSATGRTHFEIIAGETLQIRMGGSGRAVIGRAITPANLRPESVRFGNARVASFIQPVDPPPKEVTNATDRPKAYADWIANSVEGRAYQAYTKRMLQQFRQSASVASDGTFRIDDLPPGDYELSVKLFDAGEPDSGLGGPRKAEIGIGQVRFMIHEGQGEPIDLGPIEIKLID